jgi:hypothetical protein
MPHHHRFTYIHRTKAFREALDAAPPHVIDAVAEVITRLRDGTAKDLPVLPYWGDPQLGNAYTMAVPDCHAFILYREWLDQALLQLVQLVWLDD